MVYDVIYTRCMLEHVGQACGLVTIPFAFSHSFLYKLQPYQISTSVGLGQACSIKLLLRNKFSFTSQMVPAFVHSEL